MVSLKSSDGILLYFMFDLTAIAFQNACCVYASRAKRGWCKGGRVANSTISAWGSLSSKFALLSTVPSLSRT